MTNKIRQLKILVFCAAMMGVSLVTNAAESLTEGQLTLIAAPGGLVYAAGAEFGSSGTNTSFAVRAGGFSYEVDKSDYYEEGSGTIIGVTGRFYSMKLMEGMYFGAGIDLVSGRTYWREYPLYGNSTYSGIAPHAVVGYKIRSGQLSLEPNFYAAMIPGGKQVSAVVGLGLTVGVRF